MPEVPPSTTATRPSTVQLLEGHERRSRWECRRLRSPPPGPGPVGPGGGARLISGAGPLGVARPDRTVDPPVLRGRLPDVGGPLHGEPPGLVDELGHRVDEGGEHGLSDGRRNRAVELHVVHAGMPGDRPSLANMLATSSAIARHLVAGGVLRGQAGRPHLQHPSGLEHLVAREAVQGGQEAERRLAQARRTVGDERARALARADHAHGLEGAQAGAARAGSRPSGSRAPARAGAGPPASGGRTRSAAGRAPPPGHRPRCHGGWHRSDLWRVEASLSAPAVSTLPVLSLSRLDWSYQRS